MDTIKEKVNDPSLDSKQTMPMSQSQINDVGYEVSRKNLETLNESEIKPVLVDSDEEMSSDDDTEAEIEEYNHDDLKQNYINKSNETLYSINIYISDARIQTEIKNVLY